MMEKNIFLDIIEGGIPATIVHQDDRCVAFRDINPVAETHILIVPRKPIRTHANLSDDDAALMGHLHLVAKRLAEAEALESYRLVLNCEEQAGQLVPHLHLHLLGGREFAWPPG